MSYKTTVRTRTRFAFAAFSISTLLTLTGCIEFPDTYAERNQVDDNTTTGTGLGTGAGNNGTQTYLPNMWNGIATLNTVNLASNGSPTIHDAKVQTTDSGNVFVSWVAKSNLNPGTQKYANKQITIRRATKQSDGTLIWNPSSQQASYTPVGFTADAEDISFTVNPINGDGYAIWRSAGSLHISEFMGGMGHFMGSTQLSDGMASQVLVGSNGSAYLLNASTMNGGFGLNVYKRNVNEDWGTAYTLSQMDASAPYMLHNNMLTAVIDGENQIRAVWLEQRNNTMSVKSARFNLSSLSWSQQTETVVDSANTNGITLNNLHSFAVNGQANSGDANLVMFFDDGTTKSLYAATYMSSMGWHTPARLDTSTATVHIASEPAYAMNAAGNMIVGWVQGDSSTTAAAPATTDGHDHAHKISSRAAGDMHKVMGIEFMPSMNGWQPVQQIAVASSGAEVEPLRLSMNSSGEISASWIEIDATSSRALISHKKPMGSWSQTELVRAFTNSQATAHDITVTISSAGLPSLSLIAEQTSGANSTYTIMHSARSADIDNVQVATTPGTTNPGTTNPGTTDPDTTNPPVTTDPNTTNPPVTTDPANPVTNVLEGAWTAHAEFTPVETIATTSIPSANTLRLQSAPNNKIFASWNIGTLSNNMGMEKTVLRTATLGAGTNINWTNADTGNVIQNASMVTENSQFKINETSGDGYVITVNGDQVSGTEYMAGMGHIMNQPAVIATGHGPKVIMDNAGTAYIVTQTHMTGGFSLKVYKRTATNTWASDASSEMPHRMAPANSTSFSMPNHNFTARLDGRNNIFVAWLEETDNVYKIWSARYNTQNGTWGTPGEIHAHDHGNNLALNKVVAIYANATPVSDDIQLVLLQVTDTVKAVYTIDYMTNATTPGWQEVMRRDVTTATASIKAMPVVTTNMDGHTMIGWIEKDTSSGMEMNRVVTVQYSPEHGWDTPVTVSNSGHMMMAGGLQLSMNDAGNTSALWVESDSTSSKVLASHAQAHGTWSQVDLVRSIASTDGTILNNTILLMDNNIPVVLGALKMTMGANDMIHTWYNVRSTNITTVAQGANNTTPDTTNPDTTPPDDHTTPHVNASWTTPVKPYEFTYTPNENTDIQKQNIVIDNFGNLYAHSTIATNYTNSRVLEHKIFRKGADGVWQDTLEGANIFSTLSNNAQLRTVNVANNTGELFGLISDNGSYYLIRYVPGSGWSPLEPITDIPAGLGEDNLQVFSDVNGMITVTWQQLTSFNTTTLFAKHYMMSSGWQPVSTHEIDRKGITLKGSIDRNGLIHWHWYSENPTNPTQSILKLAMYNPMTSAWTSATGPVVSNQSSTIKFAVNDTSRMLVVAHDNMIDTHLNDLSTPTNGVFELNVNDSSNVVFNDNDMTLIEHGADSFILVWREKRILNNVDVYHFMSTIAHRMVDQTTGMSMLHWSTPQHIGGLNSSSEHSAKFAIDALGNTYAVWVDSDASTNIQRVFANRADSSGVWNDSPAILAEYPASQNSSIAAPSIGISSNGHIAIAWDQRMNMGTNVKHHIWVVESR